MLTSLPNMLTYSRIIIIPLLIATFYFPSHCARWSACLLFSLAAVTDFFDGYLARRSNQTSNLGRFLDPIADKLLVGATLFMLVGFHQVNSWTFIPAVIILLREILVSGLREFLAEVQVSMPVSRLAKWKTAIQMIALPLLLIGDALPSLPNQEVGEAFLWLAAALTLITGYDYLRAGLNHIRSMPLKAAPPPAPEEESDTVL